MSRADQPAPDFAGIVVAAGSSSRFDGALPKQYLELDGRLVVERSVDLLAASPAVAEVVVVVSADRLDGEYADRLRSHPAVTGVVAGGSTRADSVACGLAAVAPHTKFVLVHDAARPLASADLVGRVVTATRTHGAAVPVLRVPDTVKRVGADGRVEQTLDRDVLRLAQTPQGAAREQLEAALAVGAATTWTDEAAALESAGHTVVSVEGDPENVKITTSRDYDRVREELEGMDLRVGTGFDIHRTDPSRPLVLGGVQFEGEVGLAGHSDADVVLHAVMDAVLGAVGAGDIGTHFPPGDERWAGADSVDLARRVKEIVDGTGFGVVNLDIMVLAERPKIGPRVAEMRSRIATAFGISPTRVGIKATTLEGLGSLGRHEGLACQAVALLSRRGA